MTFEVLTLSAKILVDRVSVGIVDKLFVRVLSRYLLFYENVPVASEIQE